MKIVLSLLLSLFSVACAGAAPVVRLIPREPTGIFPPPAPVVFDVSVGYGIPPVALGFEEGDVSFTPIGGRNQAGSSVSVTRDRARGGGASARLDYAFSDAGFLEMQWSRPPSLDSIKGNAITMSLWVWGAGTDAFNSGSLRLRDAKGEVFQFRVPEMKAALNGTGWQQVTARIDLTKITETWGQNVDRVLDRPLSLLGFAFDHPAAMPARGSVFFDDIAFSVGEAQGDLRGTLRWRVRDYHNAEVARGETPIAVAAGQEARSEIRFAAPSTGIYYIEAELPATGGSEAVRADSRAAVFTPRQRPVSREPFLWAVASHPSRYPAAEATREIELARMIGFSAMRFDYDWGYIQPEQGTWRWDKYDHLFAEFQRNGVVGLPVVGYTTRWASTGDPNAADWHQWHNAPPRIDPWVAFLRESVRRYRDRTPYWEIWNEADIGFWLGTAEQYAELFNASIKAVHAEDPKAQVMNGGFSEVKRRPDFIPTFLKLANPRPDIYAFHTHMAFANLLRASEDTRAYLRGVGLTLLPTWLNEAGYSSYRGETEQMQASVLVKKMAYTAADGHEAYVWYDLRNDGIDPNEIEHHWGLVRNDFSPKASLVAAHTLLDRLGGKRFVRRVDVGSGLYALLFTDDRESVCVAWNELPSDSDVPRLLRTSAARAERVDLMGVRSPVPVKGGTLALALRGEPVFLVLPAADATLDAVDSPLQAPAALSVAPGRRASLTAEVANPLSVRLQGRLALAAAGDWKVEPASVPVDLKPGERRKVAAMVTAPAATGAPQALQVRLEADALPQAIVGVSRLRTAVVAPRLAQPGQPGQAFAGREPIVRLGTKNTVSLFEATPMAELHFKGPQDLSADVFLARAPGGILLSVRARDDVHSQTEKTEEMWKGDSLQYALAAPGGQVYEWTLAHTDAGPRQTMNIAPNGVVRNEKSAHLATRREGDATYYEVLIPDDLPGVKEMLERGGAFSVLVNDNDGKGRKGWVEWTPGIGKTKDARLFQPLVFD